MDYVAEVYEGLIEKRSVILLKSGQILMLTENSMLYYTNVSKLKAMKHLDGVTIEQLLAKSNSADKYVVATESYNSGGNSMIDLLTLNNGRILGINDECAVIYDDMDDFLSFEHKDRKALMFVAEEAQYFAEYIQEVTVIDPASGLEVGVSLYRDVKSGGIFGVDTSFVVCEDPSEVLTPFGDYHVTLIGD